MIPFQRANPGLSEISLGWDVFSALGNINTTLVVT